ncbi:alpha-hydroxy acid oxidase [Kitasatospora viridis]|uniref:4-hydroxymandelate oxidase n=1 Tax=Kitasatospora viridis TaxID=281105 RepID=A0A561UIU0_9ACTN|nr:alpha-hydroxy acid oxidase [Kitasatospora viridis]TWF99266.1 4-hydroxymandelate oxidase [Kitasatospora viridis]
MLDIASYESAAQGVLTEQVWDFIQGGSGSESALAANRAALDRLRIRPRVLVDVSQCSTATTVLGAPLAAPLGVAPMAYHRLACPDGETATAEAAGKAGSLLTVSMFASRTLEDIAAAASGPLWLQLYWLRERQALVELAARAAAAGFQALVLTVDAPRVARRPRDVRSGFSVPGDIRAVNLPAALMSSSHRRTEGASAIEKHSREQFDSSITWADLAWLRERTGLPLILKGVLTAEDARLALAHGASGVVVSNHGGRQLDSAVASADALPEVVDAVAGRALVAVDGGIRHGGDLLKVLALGADLAMVGRPVFWGLAQGGATGAAEVLRLLTEELDEAMALSGCPRLTEITRALITSR